MKLQVRLWFLDHWGDWMPAESGTDSLLSPSDYEDLRLGDEVPVLGGLLQVRAEPAGRRHHLPVSDLELTDPVQQN